MGSGEARRREVSLSPQYKKLLSRKLSFFSHIIKKSRDWLEKETVEGIVPCQEQQQEEGCEQLDWKHQIMDKAGIGGSIESNGGS